jgi:hypothetical protein
MWRDGFRKGSIVVLLLLIFTVSLASAEEKKYPPYPDVWDWQIPNADRVTGLVRVRAVYAMDNGDVMVAYENDSRDKVIKYVTFFEKIVVNNPKAVYKENYTGDAKSRIPFRNGFFLSKIGGGMRSGGCYNALGFHIAIYDKTETKNLDDKRLLYVFDRPKYYETHHPHCMDGPSFYYRVDAVSAEFLPLKDGTFLLVADDGYIIRFDENFQTKSKLINNKFFWMDDEEFRTFEAKYGDRAVGDKDLKRLYADLYKLLMNKKRRESK